MQPDHREKEIYCPVLHRSEQDAGDAFKQHTSDLERLIRKCEDLTIEKESESEEEFKKERDQLKEDCDFHAISVNETFDTFKARFDTLKTLSQNSNDGLTISAKNAFKKWNEKFRPGLVELQKGFYTIKDNL